MTILANGYADNIDNMTQVWDMALAQQTRWVRKLKGNERVEKARERERLENERKSARSCCCEGSSCGAFMLSEV
jgi:hypothetical protein